jgi:hypothetical protein
VKPERAARAAISWALASAAAALPWAMSTPAAGDLLDVRHVAGVPSIEAGRGED